MSRLIFPVRWGLLLALVAAAVSLPARQEAGKIAPAAGPSARREAPPLSEPPELAALRSKAAFHVENMPLADFAKFVSKKYKISVRLDRAGLARAGVGPTAPISARIEGVNLNAALKQILGPLKLAHCVFNGTVLITDRGPADPLAPVLRAPAVRRIVRRQPRQIVNQNPRQEQLDSLLEQVPVELLVVKKVCAPTKEQMGEIKDALQTCLKDAAEDATTATCDRLPGKIADCVASQLSQAEAVHYRDEVEKRKAHEREACIYTFVTILDQDLDFSDHQRQALVAALTPKWKPIWSQMIELTVRNGDREVPPVPDDVIVPLLDAQQAKAWKRLPKNEEAGQSFNALRMGVVGTPEDE